MQEEGVNITYNEKGVPIIEIDTKTNDSYRPRTLEERKNRVLRNLMRMEERKYAKR